MNRDCFWLTKGQFARLKPVSTENLNPYIMVMKPAQDWAGTDGSSPLNGARDRRIFVQRPVRSDVVVIASIGSQDPAQMFLAQDDKMVQALPADRANEPFNVSVLPGRSKRNRPISNAHGAQTLHEDCSV